MDGRSSDFVVDVGMLFVGVAVDVGMLVVGVAMDVGMLFVGVAVVEEHHPNRSCQRRDSS